MNSLQIVYIWCENWASALTMWLLSYWLRACVCLFDLRAEILLRRIVYDEKLTQRSAPDLLTHQLLAHAHMHSSVVAADSHQPHQHQEGCDDYYAYLCASASTWMQYHHHQGAVSSSTIHFNTLACQIEGASTEHISGTEIFQFASRYNRCT